MAIRISRPGKSILRGLAVLIGLPAATLILLSVVDLDPLRPIINRQVSAALDRPFRIEGSLQLDWQRQTGAPGWQAWIPWPRVSAERITLGNPSWASRSQMLKLERIAVSLSPLPLLRQTLSLPQITLQGLDLDLQRRSPEQANWLFGRHEDGGTASPWRIEVGSLDFDQVRIHLDDQPLAADLDLTIEPLGEPISLQKILASDDSAFDDSPYMDSQSRYTFGWQLHGQYRGQPIRGEGKVGGLGALQNPELAMPLLIDIASAGTRIAVQGTIRDPLQLAGLDLRLKLSGNSLSHLDPLLETSLPDTGAYRTSGHLSIRPQTADGPEYTYEDFSGRIGDSDIQGTLTYSVREPRPRLSGTLTSRQLRVADLAPLIGADSNAEQADRGGDAQQPAGKVLPVETFDTRSWQMMDADVRFSGQRIVRSENLPITDLQTHLTLDQGRLQLTPLNLGVAGGDIRTRLTLDGSREPLAARAELKIRHLQLRKLFPEVDTLKDSLGELNGSAHLEGRGNAVASLLGSADGSLQLAMNDGRISESLMELAGLNIGSYLLTQLFDDRETTINCAIADIRLRQGTARPRVFLLDTEDALIRVDGPVDFRHETLDLDISPHYDSLRLISLRSPLYVRGTFSQPEPGVASVPLVARAAGLLTLGTVVAPVAGIAALVAPSDDQQARCAPLLEQVRKANDR